MRTVVRGVAYLAILGAVVLVPHAIAYTLVPEYSYGSLSDAFPACAQEDSTNCYWDATIRGNGQGNSFIDVDGTAYYFSN